MLVTISAYLIACAIVSLASPTQFFANCLVVGLECLIGLYLVTRHGGAVRAFVKESIVSPFRCPSSFTFAVLSLTLSVGLFSVHFFEKDGILVRSHIYWDITAHYPIIQSFVFGDNFPARDETAAELPLFYHFFGDLQVANNVSLGASLPGALLWVSALSLTSLMILVREYSRILFRSEAAAWLAGMLVVTSSNLRWVFDLFESVPAQNFLRPLNDRGGPMRFSNPEYSFGRFNLSMVNIFYFIEERHLLFASALVVMTALLMRESPPRSRIAAVLFGALIASFSQWNFFILPMLFVIVASGLAYGERRMSRLCTLATLVVSGILLVVWTQSGIEASGWFAIDRTFPRLNFRFAAEGDGAPHSFSRFLMYYGFALGPTLVGSLIGLIVIWRHRRRDFWLLAPVILTTFILINSVQAMPNTVYENHKWLKPLQGFLNILAVAPCALLLRSASVFRVLWTGCLILVMTISGIVEAIAFTRVYTMPIAPYPSEIVTLIRERTLPHDTFVTSLPREVLLAGRRVYFLHYRTLEGTTPHLRSLGFKLSKRAAQEARVYKAASTQEFCLVARELGVDVVEFSPEQQSLPVFDLVKGHELFAVVPFKESAPRSYISTRFCAVP